MDTLSSEEMIRFLDFIEDLDAESQHLLPVDVSDPAYRIVTFLMRQHLQARIVTPTTLADAVGLPYATAVRRINDMVDAGIIVQRPRTKTGKTFSLHPSRQTIGTWYEYARRIRVAIGKTFGLTGTAGIDVNYWFGGSYHSSPVFPPPSVLERPLDISSPLRLLVHADPTSMAMQSVKRLIEQVLGVSIHNRALSVDRLRLEALDNAARPESRYDLIACNLPWIGEFCLSEVLMPLDNYLQGGDFDIADFHPAAWQGCTFRGQQYAVPIQTTPELFLYRTDIFAERGISPPRTTDDVLNAARKLHAPEKGLRGIAWNGARGTAIGQTFIMILAAFGRSILNLPIRNGEPDASNLDGEALRPLIDTAEGHLVAEYLLELMNYSPPEILSMAWHERIVSYGRGDVAMAYGYTLHSSYFELSKSLPAYGCTAFLPHPHGPGGRNIAPLGGYALGIPKNIAPARRPAAWKALELLTSAQATKLYVLNGSLVSPRFSVAADPEVRNVSNVIGLVEGLARGGMLKYWPRPPAPDIAEIMFICGEEIHDMARGLKSPATALTDAQNRADTLLRARGRY